MTAYRRRFFWAEILMRHFLIPREKAEEVVVELLKSKGPPPDKLNLLEMPVGGRLLFPIRKESSVASTITKHHKHKKGRWSTMRLGDGKRATHLEVTRRS